MSEENFDYDVAEMLKELDRLKDTERRYKALVEERAAVFEMLTQSEMQCHHLSEDGSDECENIDDCLYHSLLRLTTPEEAIDASIVRKEGKTL